MPRVRLEVDVLETTKCRVQSAVDNVNVKSKPIGYVNNLLAPKYSDSDSHYVAIRWYTCITYGDTLV